MANVHVLADGAGWIWKAVQRSLTGCVQTLDFFHACQHLSKCAADIFGEGTSAARTAYETSRGLLARHGWAGVKPILSNCSAICLRTQDWTSFCSRRIRL